jgi:hypothetical protein
MTTPQKKRNQSNTKTKKIEKCGIKEAIVKTKKVNQAEYHKEYRKLNGARMNKRDKEYQNRDAVKNKIITRRKILDKTVTSNKKVQYHIRKAFKLDAAEK